MNILITGGAGYIGSYISKQLLERTKYNIFILDNLSIGNTKTLDTLKTIREFTFIELDLKEFQKVDEMLQQNKIDAVIHFVASIVVSESVENPLKYYMNNTLNTTNLINCAVKNRVAKFIFCSIATVYGEPNSLPENGIDENFLTNLINPYGMSKFMSEKVLQDTANANKDFKYFNVSGYDINYKDNELIPGIGECHEPETHLIPLVAQTALGKREAIKIYGNDFDTFDGTCVRDCIHVEDLANAHIKAIDYLEKNDSDTFNAWYGKGYSVKEVIETMKTVTDIDFQVDNAPVQLLDFIETLETSIGIEAKKNFMDI